jgi:uncharacterized protein YjiS (DUF1127 family)
LQKSHGTLSPAVVASANDASDIGDVLVTTSKEGAMLTMTDLRSRLDAWAKYRRTVAEIERMPLDVALDLDIWREDARNIARRAVYGA